MIYEPAIHARATLIFNLYCKFTIVNREVLKMHEPSEITCLGNEDRRAILLKRINDAIKGQQAYLRIEWKRKQYD